MVLRTRWQSLPFHVGSGGPGLTVGLRALPGRLLSRRHCARVLRPIRPLPRHGPLRPVARNCPLPGHGSLPLRARVRSLALLGAGCLLGALTRLGALRKLPEPTAAGPVELRLPSPAPRTPPRMPDRSSAEERQHSQQRPGSGKDNSSRLPIPGPPPTLRRCGRRTSRYSGACGTRRGRYSGYWGARRGRYSGYWGARRGSDTRIAWCWGSVAGCLPLLFRLPVSRLPSAGSRRRVACWALGVCDPVRDVRAGRGTGGVPCHLCLRVVSWWW